MDFLKLFTPKNKLFYDLFEQMADHIMDMARLLQELINEPSPGNRTIIVSEIIRLELACDEVNHTILIELSRHFIIPFDREDIYYLAHVLDDVADYIYSSAKQISIYHIDPLDEGIHRLSQLIMTSVTELRKALHGISDLKKHRVITAAINNINACETEAGDVFDLTLDRLFEMEHNFKQLIKRRELYQTMETTTDKCRDVANLLESIIIKYT